MEGVADDVESEEETDHEEQLCPCDTAGRISKHSPQSGLTSGSLVEGRAMGPSSLTLPPLTPEGVEPDQLTVPAPVS